MYLRFLELWNMSRSDFECHQDFLIHQDIRRSKKKSDLLVLGNIGHNSTKKN